MFTIKLIQENTTTLTFGEKVVVARAGSEEFDFVLNCYDDNDSAPHQIHLDVNGLDDEVIPHFYFDRNGKTKDQLLAILVHASGMELDGSVGQYSTSSYLCIYEGDELYISLDGKTVELVR